MSRFAIAKERLLDDLEGVIADVYGSNARAKDRRRAGWNIANPFRAGAEARQMYVWLKGGRRGAWKDFVSGDKGDAIDLVAFGLSGAVTAESRLAAVDWLQERFGLRQMDPQQREAMAKAAADRRARREAEELHAQKAQRERCRKMFYSCQETIAGTPIEAYLADRRIDLAAVPHLTRSFRFHPACEYWHFATYGEGGRKLKDGPTFPALVSAMVSADGSLNALHLTYLSAAGAGKADLAPFALARGLDPRDFSAKQFKGDVGGFIIRVTNGPSGLSAEKAAEAEKVGLVGITEGIEDALSAAIAEPSLRMWAAGSLSGLLAVPDHACASGYLIFKDNDWGKPQAAATFNRAVARMRRFGKPVEVLAMPADWGKDVNDALRNEGEA